MDKKPLSKIKYPFLAMSELTKRIYIVLSNNDKIDVTENCITFVNKIKSNG